MSFKNNVVILFFVSISIINSAAVAAAQQSGDTSFFASDKDRSLMLNHLLKSYHGYGRPIFLINNDHSLPKQQQHEGKIKVSLFYYALLN